MLVEQRCKQREEERGEMKEYTYLATSTVAPGTAGHCLHNPGGGPRLKTHVFTFQCGSGKWSQQLQWLWRSHHTTRRRHGRSQARRSGGATTSTETLDGGLGFHVSPEEAQLQIDGEEQLERRTTCLLRLRRQPRWPEPAGEARRRWRRC